MLVSESESLSHIRGVLRRICKHTGRPRLSTDTCSLTCRPGTQQAGGRHTPGAVNYVKGAVGAEDRDPSPRLGGEAGVQRRLPAEGQDGGIAPCLSLGTSESALTLRCKPGTRGHRSGTRGPGPHGTRSLDADAEEAAWGRGRGGGRPYPQGLVQVPAGLLQGLPGRVRGVAHALQGIHILQAESLLLFFLLPYLGQFL